MNSVIVVTGVTGFVGFALSAELKTRGYIVRGIRRARNSNLSLIPIDSSIYEIIDFKSDTDLSAALAGAKCVVHCAGRTSAVRAEGIQALKEFREINVEGSSRLAEQAAAAGVKRIVFLSSAKVNGEYTISNKPFTVFDTVKPETPYSISKWEAEQALRTVSAKFGIELVIVRSPLVYGKAAKGNLAKLLSLIRLNVPLPLASVANMRSFVGINNLIDMLIHCIDHPDAANNTFMVSDGEDLSTVELLRSIATEMGHSLRLFPMNQQLLRSLGALIRCSDDVERLVGSLQVDIGFTREQLGWHPPMSIKDELRLLVSK